MEQEENLDTPEIKKVFKDLNDYFIKEKVQITDAVHGMLLLIGYVFYIKNATPAHRDSLLETMREIFARAEYEYETD